VEIENRDDDDRLVGGGQQTEDRAFDLTLRPRRFAEFVGQREQLSNLEVFVKAARGRREPLDHVLLCGPPGLGKTTLAHILANELDVNIKCDSGPGIEHKGKLAALLTGLKRGDVLFIDEIHRLNVTVEESLYPAVEDFQMDFVAGEGAHAMTYRIAIEPFTLVGATTRTGLLTAPMLSRFGIEIRLSYYSPEDLARIIDRSARLMDVEIDADACDEIARRARGTPRVANRLLRRARDFAEVKWDGRVSLAAARDTLDSLQIDHAGLDLMDRRLLGAIIEHYDGGPVGLDTLSASLGEPRDTIEDVIEPFLIQQGFLKRTPRGREATPRAYEHLKRTREARGGQQQLF
jgi:Holliday junction DNA helicase RuvB